MRACFSWGPPRGGSGPSRATRRNRRCSFGDTSQLIMLAWRHVPPEVAVLVAAAFRALLNNAGGVVGRASGRVHGGRGPGGAVAKRAASVTTCRFSSMYSCDGGKLRRTFRSLGVRPTEDRRFTTAKPALPPSDRSAGKRCMAAASWPCFGTGLMRRPRLIGGKCGLNVRRIAAFWIEVGALWVTIDVALGYRRAGLGVGARRTGRP